MPRIETIAAAADSRLAPYRDLVGHAPPDDVFVAEGTMVVRRLLGSPRFRPRSVLTTAAALEHLPDLPADLPVYVAPRAVVASVVGYPFHRGCLALADRGPVSSWDAFLTDVGAPARRLVALDDVAGPDNVGAILRNALALGASGAVLSPGCADPLGRKALRASAGAALLLPVVVDAAWPAGLHVLARDGWMTIALAPDGGTTLDAVPPPSRAVLLLGNEGRGLSEAARAAATVVATIPMATAMDSLNVAATSAIALYTLR